MRYFWILLLYCSLSSFGQNNEQISTMDFVQIVDNNNAEALFYYQNNWMQLRMEAVKRGQIHSYQLLETQASEDAPFHFILMTTYKNTFQFEKREEHFRALIKEQGGLKLLNEKKPAEFRKTLFSKESAIHLEE